jgi:hypothetical protein
MGNDHKELAAALQPHLQCGNLQNEANSSVLSAIVWNIPLNEKSEYVFMASKEEGTVICGRAAGGAISKSCSELPFEVRESLDVNDDTIGAAGDRLAAAVEPFDIEGDGGGVIPSVRSSCVTTTKASFTSPGP